MMDVVDAMKVFAIATGTAAHTLRARKHKANCFADDKTPSANKKTQRFAGF
jgi:hypothetical protein